MKEDEMKPHVAHIGEMGNPHNKEKAVKILYVLDFILSPCSEHCKFTSG
jgi:hypothetical protein